RGLAGDPRVTYKILYVLSDSSNATNRGVYAIDVSTGMGDNFVNAADPVIAPICVDGTTERNSIPINPSAISAAIAPFVDASPINGGSHLAVYSTAASATSGSTLDVIALDDNVAPNAAELPQCSRTSTD